MSPESIVLVDDVRSNFQSPGQSRKQVVRYCKVARYDCQYREMGLVADMGGIGAKNVEDFDTLVRFVQAPWEYKAPLAISCIERPFDSSRFRPPVQLVVFDFDGTLTLYTFMPTEPQHLSEIGYDVDKAATKSFFTQYNFDSPYVPDRLAKLSAMLESLKRSEDGLERKLVVLTRNEAGAVSILNLLMMADIADFFSAVWALDASPDAHSGVYRATDGTWQKFSLPMLRVASVQEEGYKASVLKAVIDAPKLWLPQLAQEAADSTREDLAMQSIVYVDKSVRDKSENSSAVLRSCQVPFYSDVYRDQGFLCHMGGIGAKNEDDYDVLLEFVDKPWNFTVDERVDGAPSFCLDSLGSSGGSIPLDRCTMDCDDLKGDGLPTPSRRSLSKRSVED